MIKRLFVIGDSFTVPCNYAKGWDNSCFWIERLKSLLKLNNIDVTVDGIANRDVQTILDNWIKLIPYLNETDSLVICLPYFRRTRVPLKESNWYESYKPYPKDIKIINRFVGPQMVNEHMKLEFWDNELSSKELIKIMQNQEIINSTISSQLNQIEIVDSLLKLTPCNNFVFTWDEMEHQVDFIKDKLFLTKEIGFWQTLNDEWLETNGEIGQKNDFHWGSKFNTAFADYLFGKLNNYLYI
jgi:hypothetical protein